MNNKCERWHSDPLINPDTNRSIKKTGSVYKMLVHECGPPPRRKSPRRKSPRRKSPRRKSPRRKSPRRKSPRRNSPRRNSPRRNSPRRNSPRRNSPRPKSPRPRLNSQRVEIYCGNNSRDEGLLNGSKILGTRYQCLKKGVGKGLAEPVLVHNLEYEPIEDYGSYCGLGSLPENKLRFGTREECLRKGFGIGQKIKYDREGLQQTPIITRDRNWYKILVPQ